MSMKPKTVRRLILLGVAGTIVLGAAVGLIVVRRWQSDRLLTERRAEGFEAFEKRDYARAIDRLGPYLKRREDDADALLRYCRARWKAEEAGGEHARQAIGVYRKYLRMRPDDREAAVELLRIYNIVGGFQPEARDLALRFRPEPPDQSGAEHVPVLKEELIALRGTRDQVLKDRGDRVGARLSALAPLDLDVQWMYIFDWLGAQDKAADAAERIRELRQTQPDDIRPRILEFFARSDLNQLTFDAVAKELARLVGLDPANPASPALFGLPDEPTVLRVVFAFDKLGRWDLGRALLRQVADPVSMPVAFRLRVRRAWYDRDVEELLAVTDAAVPDSPDWHAEVLGFRAAALAAAGRDADARALTDALAARRGDFRSAPWALVALHVARPDRDATAAVADLARAIKAHAAEPVFYLARAEALMALNRPEEAVADFRRAGEPPIGGEWVQPWIRLAQANLQLGLVAEAVDASERALRVAPNTFAAVMMHLNAKLARVERAPGPTGEETVLLRDVDRLLAAIAKGPDTAFAATLGDQLLAGRILLLARTDGVAEARSAVSARLSAGEPPAREVLERVAIVSLREGVGVEQAALDLADQAHGPAPSTAAIRAQVLRANGQAADAAAMLRAGAAGAPADQRRDWAMALAVFLDQIDDPGALTAWRELAAAHPDDPGVQTAVLRTRSAAKDDELMKAAAARLIHLTEVDPERSPVLRLAKARAKLADRPSARDRDEAIPMLRALIADQPQLLEARLMLADALLLEDPDPSKGLSPDIAAAITVLTEAAGLASEPGPIVLRVAELRQRRREFDAARAELSRLVARDAPASPAVRRRAAELLAAQGRPEDAIPVFEEAAADGDATDRLKLAELYALARRDAEALALLRALADEAPDPEKLVAIAVWLDRLGDPEAAERASARIATVTPEAARREFFLGRREAGRGRWAAAAERFRAAAGADPAWTDAWIQWAEALVAAGDTPAAAAAVAEALRAHPGDKRLQVAQERITAAQAGEAPDLAALAGALAAEPGQAAFGAVVAAVDAARKNGDLDREKGLVALAEKFPESWPVQNLVVGRLMSLLPPRYDQAAPIVDRAIRSFPTSTEPARLAFNVFSVHGKEEGWARALTAAREWLRRDSTRSMEPHAAIAEAQIQLGLPAAAWETLRPQVPRAQAEADAPGPATALGVAARALLAAGRTEEAWTVLAPALARSPLARTRVLIPLVAGGTVPPAEAPRWLERAEPMFPAQAVPERAALAEAWAVLAAGNADQREAALGHAAGILEPLVGREGAEPVALLAQAEVDRIRGDRAAARRSCLRALEADPKLDAAMERLAQIVIGDEDGARVLAETAARVTSQTGSPAPWLIVGRAHEGAAAGESGEAAGARRRAALEAYRAALVADPNQSEALIRSAAVAEKLGDASTALEFYDRALALPGLVPGIRPVVQNNAAYCIVTQAQPSPEALNQAMSLARAACDAAPLAAFLDTLAHVQLKSGSRSDAIVTYRRALSIDPGYSECLIGLAEVLATGSPPEQDEARRLIARIPVSQNPSATLTEEQSTRLARIRSSLGL